MNKKGVIPIAIWMIIVGIGALGFFTGGLGYGAEKTVEGIFKGIPIWAWMIGAFIFLIWVMKK